MVSVTRNSTGKYTIVLGTTSSSLDFYYKLLAVNTTFDATGNSGTAPAAPFVYMTGNAVATPATCSFTLQCTNSAGTATDPASGEAVWLEIILSNSGAA